MRHGVLSDRVPGGLPRLSGTALCEHPTVLTVDRYVASLRRDAETLTDVLRAADSATPVPDCPGWTLLDLGRHLASVHRWAQEIVTTGDKAEEPEAPTDPATLVAWFVEGADLLATALREVDPVRPTWSFGPPPRLASFWPRRQAHETAMHLGDALRAVGRADEAVQPPDLAADGVDEVVTVFFPRQVRFGRTEPLTAGVRLELSDVPGASWVLAGDGTDPGAAWSATVRGPAYDVLLALWGRAGLATLEVTGDADAARVAFSGALTP